MRGAIALICFFFAFETLSTQRSLPREFQGRTREEVNAIIMSKNKRNADNAGVVSDSIKAINSAIRKKVVYVPDLGDEKVRVKKFEMFEGIVDGIIVSSALGMDVRIVPISARFPEGAYFTCRTSNLSEKYNFRVLFNCDTLVTDDGEFEVEVSIKDEYKVDGLLSDEVFNGEGEGVFGAIFGAIGSAVIDGTKSQETSLLGTVNKRNMGNLVRDGAQAGIANSVDTINQHTAKNVLILRVNDRRKVIINFVKGFSYEG